MAKKKNIFKEMQAKLISWKLVQKNGWAIKISIIEENNILLIFASRYTGQTWLTYCFTEVDALKQIDFITSKNAQQYIDNGVKF